MDLCVDLQLDIDDIIDFIQEHPTDDDIYRELKREPIDSNCANQTDATRANTYSLSSTPDSSTTGSSNCASSSQELAVVPTSSVVLAKPKSKKDRLPKVIREALAPKKCVICGGPTKCLHYEVASCHSCKAFFRRSVLKRAKYICKVQGRCEVGSGIRCRSCRYDRCILAGMNIESMQLSDAEIVPLLTADVDERRKAIVDRQLPTSTVKAIMSTDRCLEVNTVSELLYLESRCRHLRESSFNPRELYLSDIRTILAKPPVIGDAEKYQRQPGWPLTMAQLEADRPRSPPFKSMRFADAHFKHHHWPTIDLVLAIDTAKTLPGYRKLQLRDQEVLLRHVALVNTVITHAFYSYRQNATTITHPNGFQPLVARYNWRHTNTHVDMRPLHELMPQQLEYDVFCRNIECLRRVGVTEEEYVLLKALVYFLNVPDLSDAAREVLAEESHKYGRILLRHMQSTLGAAAGAKKYAEVIALVDTFLHFGKRQREFHVFLMTVGPWPAPSLLLEWAAMAY